MRRLRIALALAAALALSVALAACGGSGDKSGESPQTVLEEATLQGIESGDVDLALDLSAPGAEGGKVAIALSGPFQGEGQGSLPQLAMTATAQGKFDGRKVDFDGGLTLLPNTAYVRYEGIEYEVDPTTFSFVEQTLKQAQRESGAETGAAGVAGCQEELGKLKVADFLENGRNEGSAEVGGTSTTKVSGELNVSGAIDSLLEVLESRPCRSQLAAAGPLPSQAEIEKAEGEIAERGEEAPGLRLRRRRRHRAPHLGRADGRTAARRQGPEERHVGLDLKLTGVNEEQKISAPQNAKPLSKLFLKLGVNPIELLGLLQGEEGGEGLGGLLEGLGRPAAPASNVAALEPLPAGPQLRRHPRRGAALHQRGGVDGPPAGARRRRGRQRARRGRHGDAGDADRDRRPDRRQARRRTRWRSGRSSARPSCSARWRWAWSASSPTSTASAARRAWR